MSLRSKFERDVQAFHRKFGVPNGARPRDPGSEQAAVRIRLIREETDELIDAIQRRNIADIASESIDVLYVVFGTLAVYGIRAVPIWNAIHGANMRKVRNPSGGKVLKPKGWEPADVRAEIHKQMS